MINAKRYFGKFQSVRYAKLARFSSIESFQFCNTLSKIAVYIINGFKWTLVIQNNVIISRNSFLASR